MSPNPGYIDNDPAVVTPPTDEARPSDFDLFRAENPEWADLPDEAIEGSGAFARWKLGRAVDDLGPDHPRRTAPYSVDRSVVAMTDEARAPEQTVEPRTEAGRLMAEVLGPECGDLRGYILAIEREAATVAAPPLDPTAGEVEEWLDGGNDRLYDLMGLWTSGKRSSQWVAKQLIDEGHLARLSQPSPDEPTP